MRDSVSPEPPLSHIYTGRSIENQEQTVVALSFFDGQTRRQKRVAIIPVVELLGNA